MCVCEKGGKRVRVILKYRPKYKLKYTYYTSVVAFPRRSDVRQEWFSVRVYSVIGTDERAYGLPPSTDDEKWEQTEIILDFARLRRLERGWLNSSKSSTAVCRIM